MTDEHNETDDETEEERDSTYRGAAAPTDIDNIDRHRVDTMSTAIDIVPIASDLDELRYLDEVCDEQRELIDEAREATLEAADAVWSGDEGVPMDD